MKWLMGKVFKKKETKMGRRSYYRETTKFDSELSRKIYQMEINNQAVQGLMKHRLRLFRLGSCLRANHPTISLFSKDVSMLW